jgi:phenylacetate-coenzyme A ligase PaaK-like adenylate-forming protein
VPTDDRRLPTDPFAARCLETLEDALAHVPAYRTWRAFDPGPGASVDDRYRALPALTKPLMNLHAPAAFVAQGGAGARSLEQGLRDGAIELVTTSGTTDDTIENAWYQPWWDASERASWALNAHARRICTGDHREAILVNARNVGFPSAAPLPFERRRLGRFLYLNERTDLEVWPDAHWQRMLEELARFQPAVLEGNPSHLSRLARHARRAGVRPFQPALIVLTYEYPSLLHRRQIAAAFDAPVVSSYGSTEAAYVFMECEHGRLHQNVASCRVDLLPFAAGRASPEVGALLITTFDNPWRALLRFDAGDLGRRADGPCPCGRSAAGLTLSAIEGRAINLTLGPEGRLVTQADVDRRLAAIPGLDEYQLLQTDPRSYALRVGSDGDAAALVAPAEAALRELYGPAAHLSVSPTGPLAAEASGKYRLVKTAFPIDAMDHVEPGLRPPLPAELTASR